MDKNYKIFSGIGFQIVETDLVLIYTKCRVFQWEETKLMEKHPSSSQSVVEYTELESNQWQEGGKTMVVAEEKAFCIPQTSQDEIPQLPI